MPACDDGFSATAELLVLYCTCNWQFVLTKIERHCVCCYVLIGRNAVGNQQDPIPTDPFMMLIVPYNHFHDKTALVTATFCEIQNGVQVSIVVAFIQVGPKNGTTFVRLSLRSSDADSIVSCHIFNFLILSQRANSVL